ncbi:aspartic protein-like protein 1 [Dorcoceras hygrometricum]|uniref:Aspartic protein-like protein 1 n=1 Tax=Dorcoceras hygrometricum TaxID=472368 RepID=A0A2Z7CR70_9LAMI|nr:aspartic protein-like protein 1 [Dorcoceras hygrometricum]
MALNNLVLIALIVSWNIIGRSEAFGTSFGFDIHHRYSETVKGFLDVSGLPEKGSLDYFAAMVHRDQFLKSRHLHRRNLAETAPSPTPVTFSSGNSTLRLSFLGFLHYAVVEVGTPKVQFIVALDSGSDLFWLPCECTRCLRSLNATAGPIPLNQYRINASSSSEVVPCNSPICGRNRRCAITLNACAYQEVYLSRNTSSTGVLVEDVLHLATADIARRPVQAPITLGCGVVQTGDFLEKAAPNGLFGLGMDNVSVPSILASKGIVPNSFSMCFSPDGRGRLEFGDKGSSDQKTTPYNLDQLRPSYNVTVSQLTVGKQLIDLEFSAIFDTGTSFTYLTDPVYSAITESFNSQETENQRYVPQTKIIFEYCYQLSATEDTYYYPKLNFTMRGGSPFHIKTPTFVIPTTDGGDAYCLAIVKSTDVNLIGQNFMTGYRLTFDREDMVLGWKEANCYDPNGSPTVPVNKGNTPPPPPSIFEPQVTPNRTRSAPPPPSPPPPPARSLFGNAAPSSTSFMDKLLLAIFSLVFHQFIILS